MRPAEDLTIDILKGLDISDLGTHYSLAKSRVTYLKNQLKKATGAGVKRLYQIKLREAQQYKDSLKDLIIQLYRGHAALQGKQVFESTITSILKKVEIKVTVIDKT